MDELGSPIPVTPTPRPARPRPNPPSRKIKTPRGQPLEDDPLAGVDEFVARAKPGTPRPPVEGPSDTPPATALPPVQETEKAAPGVTENGTPAQGADWAEFMRVYGNDPVAFVQDILLRNYPGWIVQQWQADVLNAVARGERRISIRAGHGVGKSAVCSWALVWHMVTRFPQKAICTAPTAGQLFDALFAEVKRWINELPPPLRAAVEPFSDRVVLKAAPESSFISARTSSAERPEALAGVHSEHVLLIADEASAIPEPVFEAAAGSMSGFTATTILISNPTRNSGLFFNTHHKLSEDWLRFHVSCVGNPLVTPDFVAQIRNTYGENSNAYRVRVLGEFALHEDDVLIPAEAVDAAMVRDIALDTNAPLLYGVDVARFGDDRSVLCKRQGNSVVEFKSWTGADLMETVGRVVHEANVDKPAEILVDSIGLGAGVADRLRELGFNVRDVNVAEAAAMNPQAARLRDELWLTARDWLMKRTCRLPKDQDLRQELVSPTYTFTSLGKIKVEGKADMKKRGLRSPDKADALCLTFAGYGALVAGRGSMWVTGKPLTRGIKGVV